MEAVKHRKHALIIMLIILMPSLAFSVEKSGWHWIKAEKVHDMLKEGSGLWLIDVRSPLAFETEHIEGAVNISSAMLAHKKFPKNRAIILVDDSLGQKNAKAAAEILVKNGYVRVYVLDGGVIGWDIEGYPVAKSKPFVRGVTAEELNSALSSKVTLKVFDMRNKAEREKGFVRNSEHVDGNNINERIEKLKELLKKGEGRGLAGKLKKPQTIILVFSAAEDAEGLMSKIIWDKKSDVRYLIGGYESMAVKKGKDIKASGECPSCPENKKK